MCVAINLADPVYLTNQEQCNIILLLYNFSTILLSAMVIYFMDHSLLIELVLYKGNLLFLHLFVYLLEQLNGSSVAFYCCSKGDIGAFAIFL